MFRAEVGPLLNPGGEFCVVRNKDWFQTFSVPADGGREGLAGPGAWPENAPFSLEGLRGDVFEVEFIAN